MKKEVRELLKHFTDLTGLKPPKDRSVNGYAWYGVLYAMLEKAGGSVELAKKGMSAACQRLTQHGYQVYSPLSLLKTYESIMDERLLVRVEFPRVVLCEIGPTMVYANLNTIRRMP